MLAGLLLALAMPKSPAPPVVSPEVHPDGRVTFRLQSPNAKKVSVGVEGKASQNLEKSGDGVWSATTAPLAPDIYGYTLSVDGISILDPSNPQIKPNLLWVGNLVTVPGKPPELWEVQDVPRGEVHRHFYRSPIVGDHRDFFVYTPPNYRTAKAKLPVLYLLHGFSDTAIGWTEVGKAHVILDNLIAQGKAKPMLVVMPLGYGVPNFASPGGRAFADQALARRNFDHFGEALLKEVIPAVERDYRVSTKREHRAIAGLSMGGAESLMVGLNHPETFGAIGAFSSGGFPAGEPSEALLRFDAKQANTLKPLWIACGTEDFLIGFHRSFTKWLEDKGVKATIQETPGGHVWMLWRRNLAEFTQKIFR